jgi:hypothetical protein
MISEKLILDKVRVRTIRLILVRTKKYFALPVSRIINSNPVGAVSAIACGSLIEARLEPNFHSTRRPIARKYSNVES